MNPRQQLQRPTSPRPQGSNKFFIPAGALAGGALGGGAASGLLAPLLGLGGSIASTIFGNQGRKRREQDARKYNLEQWHRQNQYNHPLEQMERLRSAGLNPNMIYGSSPGSAVGNAGAVAPGKAPDYKVENPVLPGFQSGQLQAQSNNLTANALNTLELRGLNKVNKEKAQATKGDLIEIVKHELTAKREAAFQQILISAGMSQKDTGFISRYAAETRKMIAEGNVAESKAHVEKLNEKLAKVGIRPNDPLSWRIWSLVSGINLNDAEAVRNWFSSNFLGKLNLGDPNWTPEWKD